MVADREPGRKAASCWLPAGLSRRARPPAAPAAVSAGAAAIPAAQGTECRHARRPGCASVGIGRGPPGAARRLAGRADPPPRAVTHASRGAALATGRIRPVQAGSRRARVDDRRHLPVTPAGPGRRAARGAGRRWRRRPERRAPGRGDAAARCPGRTRPRRARPARQDLLGGEVAQRADQAAAAGQRGGRGGPRDADVDDPRAGRGDQDVARAEVAVHRAGAVDRRERLGQPDAQPPHRRPPSAGRSAASTSCERRAPARTPWPATAASASGSASSTAATRGPRTRAATSISSRSAGAEAAGRRRTRGGSP